MRTAASLREMIDFYRMNDRTTLFAGTFNTLFRLPLAIFGFVCLVTGIAIIVHIQRVH